MFLRLPYILPPQRGIFGKELARDSFGNWYQRTAINLENVTYELETSIDPLYQAALEGW